MNPVRKAAVISLLEWIRRNKPNIRSLSSLSETAFMDIVTEFELSKGVDAIIDPMSNLRRKWEVAHWQLKKYGSDTEALANYRG